MTDKTPEQLAHDINLLLAGQQINHVAEALALVLLRFSHATGQQHPAHVVASIANLALTSIPGAAPYESGDLAADRTIN